MYALVNCVFCLILHAFFLFIKLHSLIYSQTDGDQVIFYQHSPSINLKSDAGLVLVGPFLFLDE